MGQTNFLKAGNWESCSLGNKYIPLSILVYGVDFHTLNYLWRSSLCPSPFTLQCGRNKESGQDWRWPEEVIKIWLFLLLEHLLYNAPSQMQSILCIFCRKNWGKKTTPIVTIILESTTMAWMFVSVPPPKKKPFSCWNLIPSVIVLGLGAFEKWVGHEGVTLMNWISVLIKEPGEFPRPILQVLTWWEHGRLWTRKQTLTWCWVLPMPWSNLQNCEK